MSHHSDNSNHDNAVDLLAADIDEMDLASEQTDEELTELDFEDPFLEAERISDLLIHTDENELLFAA